MLKPAANAAAIEFNKEHSHDQEYTTTAAEHSEDFILWACGVKAGRGTATRLMVVVVGNEGGLVTVVPINAVVGVGSGDDYVQRRYLFSALALGGEATPLGGIVGEGVYYT